MAERSSSGSVRWLVADPFGQGTVSVEVDALNSASVTRRWLDPHGNLRGSAVAWSSPHGFLNQPVSSTTGLVQLGARDYDPVLGRFLSVDPVLDPAQPQQNNGYGYGWNNPIGNADPSGLMVGCADVCSASTSTATHQDSVGDAPGVSTSTSDPGVDVTGTGVSYPALGIWGSSVNGVDTIDGVTIPHTKGTHVDLMSFTAGFASEFSYFQHKFDEDPWLKASQWDPMALRHALMEYCDQNEQCVSDDLLFDGSGAKELGKAAAGGSPLLLGALIGSKFSGAYPNSGKNSRDSGNLAANIPLDGSHVPVYEALNLAQDYLGPNYSEPVPGSGRYISSDGTRVVRMGDSDITGAHGGGLT
ncbi:MAG TPA: RHS repeat-associated core domain-containing protein [Jatrophihabitans sp.]|nr:RHS repeat-associated core domain-containing protein [Jatrophihabitans sp.]